MRNTASMRNRSTVGYDDIQRLANDKGGRCGLYRHAQRFASGARDGGRARGQARAVRKANGQYIGRSASHDRRVQGGGRQVIAYRCQFEVFNSFATRLVQSGMLGRPRIIEATNAQAQGPGEQWRLRASLAGGGALPDIGLVVLPERRASSARRGDDTAENTRFCHMNRAISCPNQRPTRLGGHRIPWHDACSLQGRMCAGRTA